MSVHEFTRWLSKQIGGFMRGVSRLASKPTAKWLPRGIWSTLFWFYTAIVWSFGSSTPGRQITASVALATIAIFSSYVTLGATIALVVLFLALAGVGVLRLIPVVNRGFVRVRSVVIPRA